jgi:hypothetical protein
MCGSIFRFNALGELLDNCVPLFWSAHPCDNG